MQFSKLLSVRSSVFASVVGCTLTFGVLGCQPDRPDLIPSGAIMMQSGNGMAHFTAPDDGTVFVYDHQTNKLLWSGQVKKGMSVDVNPTKQQIMVNDHIAANNAVSATDRNDIYFQPAPPAPVVPPAPAPAPVTPPPAPAASGNTFNGGFTVTPSVTVDPASGTNGSVTVHSGLNVAPATQPSTVPSATPSQP